VRESGLAESGGAVEEEVVEGFLALLGRLDGDREVVLQFVLADELREAPGTERIVQRLVFVADVRGDYSFISAQRSYLVGTIVWTAPSGGYG
jgi:hypothetical protein